MSSREFKVGDLVGLVDHVGVRMFVAEVGECDGKAYYKLCWSRSRCSDRNPNDNQCCWTASFLHSDLYPISTNELDESLMKSFTSIIRGRANLLIGRADHLVGSLYADIGCVKKSDHYLILNIIRGMHFSAETVKFITANMPAMTGYLCEILDCEAADLVGIAENNDLTIYGLKEG